MSQECDSGFNISVKISKTLFKLQQYYEVGYSVADYVQERRVVHGVVVQGAHTTLICHLSYH